MSDVGDETQKPFFLVFPLKSAVDMKTLMLTLPPMLPQMFEAADSIGTIHFARFVVLNETTLAFISEYDGTLEDYIMDFTKSLGPLFDMIFKHVQDAPATPIAKNSEALLAWVKTHNPDPLAFYSGYPGLRVQDIKAQAEPA